MHTIIVIIHVIAMMISLGLMSTAVVMGLFGKQSAVNVATLGLGATAVGGVSGTFLLLGAPLTIQCAILTAYLIGVTALYVFGFALGDAENARLIRKTSPIQNR